MLYTEKPKRLKDALVRLEIADKEISDLSRRLVNERDRHNRNVASLEAECAVLQAHVYRQQEYVDAFSAYERIVAALNDYKTFGWADKLEEACRIANGDLL